MYVLGAVFINDRGEIACTGTTTAVPNEHPCMLIPCDENHHGVDDCDYSLVDSVGAESAHPSHDVPNPAVRGASRSIRIRSQFLEHMP
jgi:hypothetical protein